MQDNNTNTLTNFNNVGNMNMINSHVFINDDSTHQSNSYFQQCDT